MAPAKSPAIIVKKRYIALTKPVHHRWQKDLSRKPIIALSVIPDLLIQKGYFSAAGWRKR
ncbi:TPA: hypothetical protein ACTXFQ_002524 [Raoultella planticola]